VSEISSDNFSTRIRELRTREGLSQKAIAGIAGIDARSIRRFEAGIGLPNLAVLLPLAEYFKVSMDYLIGRSDDPILHR
jgi:transcriptional regulator with XRE-family HTH domain